ncbi:MAG: hypothetical protein ABIP17_14140 [Ilumatobacteraceae bacterium]
MALIPRIFRPKFIIRRKALSAGIFGQSTFWKVVAVWVFGKTTLKKFFGKNTEVIDVSRLGGGRYMQLATAKPVNRRERKRLRKAGMEPPTLKEHRELGKLWTRSRARDRRTEARRAQMRDAS